MSREPGRGRPGHPERGDPVSTHDPLCLAPSGHWVPCPWCDVARAARAEEQDKARKELAWGRTVTREDLIIAGARNLPPYERWAELGMFDFTALILDAVEPLIRADERERIAQDYDARAVYWRKAGANGVADIFDEAAQIARNGGPR